VPWCCGLVVMASGAAAAMGSAVRSLAGRVACERWLLVSIRELAWVGHCFISMSLTRL
jgi:hypothetical protein